MTMSKFSGLAKAERDEVFSLMAAYSSDSHPHRVNLGPGIYCTDEGTSWPFEVVARVEKELHEQQDIRRHDYLAIEGDPRFLSVARDLIFSLSDTKKLRQLEGREQSRIVSVQTISGTGANHVGARFLAQNLRPRRVWLSNPTWANHHLIWQGVGVPVSEYPYYDASNASLDFAAMMATLEQEAQPRDVLVLHACAHNPTGIDPSREQWIAIAELCQRKDIFPFFDSAYQGFASGDPDKDAWAVSYFYQLQPRLEMCVAQSFSKNFGLYGQRVGAFHLVTNDPSLETQYDIQGNLAQIIRSEYSVSPRYGSTIVRTILENESLSKEWMSDLQVVSGRIKAMRHALYDELCRLGTPKSWRHIIDQVCHSMCRYEKRCH